MGIQKFGTGDVLGPDQGDAQGIQTVGASERPWTHQDDVELEHEGITGGTSESAREE